MVFNYYKIVNKSNKKVYIGITEKKFEIRWKQHISLLKRQKHPNKYLQMDWDLYGTDNFIFEKIESIEFDTLEEGYYHEFELIQNSTEEKYNILIGGLINPMYTSEVKEKMIKTKQEQVPNIYQLEEIEENVFKVINKFNSQKEAGRLTSADQGNIQHAIAKHTKGCGYYWVTEEQIKTFEKDWFPSRTKITPCAQLDENGNIVKVHHNRSLFEKEYNWTTGCIKGAIARNGKTHNIKFINISKEEYYKIRPITLLF